MKLHFWRGGLGFLSGAHYAPETHRLKYLLRSTEDPMLETPRRRDYTYCSDGSPQRHFLFSNQRKSLCSRFNSINSIRFVSCHFVSNSTRLGDMGGRFSTAPIFHFPP